MLGGIPTSAPLTTAPAARTHSYQARLAGLRRSTIRMLSSVHQTRVTAANKNGNSKRAEAAARRRSAHLNKTTKEFLEATKDAVVHYREVSMSWNKPLHCAALPGGGGR